MRLKFHNKKISGILTVAPTNISFFDDEINNYEFSFESSMKLKATMGYNSHRIFDDSLCVSDIAVKAFNYLFNSGKVEKDSIDALILVTETPDHILPPTSNIIQGLLNMKEDMICLDINQGCAGYEVGLIQAFMMLEQEGIRKVALVNAELLSRKVSKKDRNSYPLIGDALSITIVEKESGRNTIYANVKMDGRGAFAIQIPAGGLRKPSSVASAELKQDSYGNWRSEDNLVMKGDEVFMFVQKKVPVLINDILEFSGKDKDEIDYFAFHQPNKFMLTKLASKLRIPNHKMPSNIVEIFGNSSSVTVPMNIVYNMASKLLEGSILLCMSGFGIGLAWSSIIMEVGNLNFCEMIEV